ncbi:SRPBCC domain-containing protein [soil metagenome]
MEYGSIEREIQIDASPEVVFEVISSPEHLKEWWPDEVTLDPTPGGTGELVFGNDEDPRAHVASVTVVEAEPYRLFSFRWTHPADQVATATNSLLVTFELTPSGGGTSLRMTEAGFREQGWEVAVLEETYNDHANGWNFFIPRLGEYVNRLVASR